MASDNQARSGKDWEKRLAGADKVRLVLAGNRGEFLGWCRRVNRMPGIDARYIERANQLRGIDWTKYEIVLVGNYKIGPGWLDVYEDMSFIQKMLGASVREA